MKKKNQYSKHFDILAKNVIKYPSLENIFLKNYEDIHNTQEFALISHDKNHNINYVNSLGLKLFGYTEEEFLGIPSKLTAPSIHQKERQQTLELVSQQGYTKNYNGIRINKEKKLFEIHNATIWYLENNSEYYGVAAIIRSFQFL